MSNNPRRSMRNQQPSKPIEKLKNVPNETNNSTYDIEEVTRTLSLDDIEVNHEQPTELFDESNDVDGSNMYPVNNQVKKGAMIEKAKQCTVDTEKLNNKKAELKLVKIDDKWTVDSKKKKEGKNKPATIVEEIIRNAETEEPLRRITRSRANDYHMKAEQYFAIQSEKTVTSNNTLSRLKNRHLDEEKLQKLLANNCHVSEEHQKNIKSLLKTHQKFYEYWLHTMEEGFTVLLYGLGSKRLLINQFREEMIPQEPALIINGFFPSLTVKEILDNIITELLGLESVTNQNECFDIIERTMNSHPEERIYLLIHNIDGGMLRSNKTQDVLSRLASIKNVNILASVDHINAPLIWDNVKRARYNFYWMEAPTLLQYEAETSYESSLLVQKSGALALLSLQNVFASLTSNAKSIYIILVKYQLENDGNNYSGMAFKDLYRASREAFLVSSDQALRAQLTEFVDHKLVRNKRNIEGAESLVISLDNALLKQFLEQQDQA